MSCEPDIEARLIPTPPDLFKIQKPNSLLEKPSVKTIALRMYKQRGLRGLYRGFTATVLRDFGYGAYFCSVSRLTIHHILPDPYLLGSTKPLVVFSHHYHH
jgi:hypothetical protein